MDLIKLNGKDITKDAEIIRNNFKDKSKKGIVYIFTHPTSKLFAYIDALKDNEVNNNIMFDLKICYEKRDLKLSFVREGSQTEEKISSISELIERLDGNECSVIVEDNSRNTLAEVSQQLIYIGYPLTSVNIMLRREVKDAQKTKRFMAKINDISASIDKAITNIDELNRKWGDADIAEEEKQNLINTISEAKQRCSDIRIKVEKAKSVEMTIAVAATKKTGKSVIVNSMIGEELAPTSLTLATPNTCVYKKSSDNQYHLNYNGKRIDYSTSGELHKVITAEFKKAQENVGGNLCIPDMEIEYVTDGNNFDTFTIFDTPGPDLAGAGHHISTFEAMKKCDVAVFALDYSKYLTNDEEKFLRTVKDQFNANKKFASLLFAINKLDLRFIDANTTKSIVYAIDLIRDKLINIDEMYKDCIIFATSAVQYYNTIDCERACGDEFTNAENLIDSIKEFTRQQSDEVIHDEMATLTSLVGYYEMSVGLDKMTANDLKQYSGMPDLLNYAAYICKSKARDEIVNSITVSIDSHTKALQSISDRIDNIDKLIAGDQEQIQRIKSIIDEYYSSIKDILTDEIFLDELEVLQNKAGTEETEEAEVISGSESNIIVANNGTLRFYFGTSGRDRLTLNDLERMMAERILSRYTSDYKVVKAIFDFMKPKTYQALTAEIEKYQKSTQITKEDVMYNDDINRILNSVYSEDAFVRYVKEYIIKEIKLGAETTIPEIALLKDEITQLLNMRIGLIQNASENCKTSLEKLDISLSVPKLPEFNFELSAPNVDPILDTENIDMHINTEKIRALFVKKKMGFIRNFFFNWKNWRGDFKDSYFLQNFSRSEYFTKFDELQSQITDALVDADAYGKLKDENQNLSDRLSELVEKIQSEFSDMLDSLNDNVTKFSNLVDDTEKHRENIEAHEREKELIHELNKSFKDFASNWEEVLKTIETKEEMLQ